MSSQSIKILVPAKVTPPRGAIGLGRVMNAAFALVRGARRWIEQSQRERGIRHEIAQVRRTAQAWRQSDPRMAADLLAAADRYEAEQLGLR